MYYSSKNSRHLYYHHEQCRYVKQIRDENKQSFYTVEEAQKHGLTLCPHCSRIGRQYAADRAAVDAFCGENHFKHFLQNGELYIVSAGDTAWRICCPNEGRIKVLLHESKEHMSYARRKTPYENREYHTQNVYPTNLMGYLVYILNHDRFEKERTEQRKAENALRREEVKNIQAVKQQIYRQNRKRRKTDYMKSQGQKRHRANQQLRALAASFSNYRSAVAAMI